MQDPIYIKHVQKISDWMTRYYQKNNPGKRRSKQNYEAIADRYLQACRKAIFVGAGWTIRYPDKRTLQMCVDQIRQMVPEEIMISGKSHYWAYILRDKFPLWTVIQTGTPGERSHIDINHTPLWRSIVNNSISQKILEDHEIYEKISGLIDDSQMRNLSQEATYELIPVDVKNLDNAIGKFLSYYNEAYLENNTGRMTMVIKMIAQARNIHNATMLMSAEHGEKLIHFPTIKKHRKYYLGDLNLLGCLKEVRHAALGECHEYDLRGAVFSFYADYCRRNKLENTHISAYVANIDQVRHLLAEIIQPYLNKPLDDCLDIIKTYLTALGFGANSMHGYYDAGQNKLVYGALPEILMEPEARKALHETDILQGMIAEIKGILDHVKQNTNDAERERWCEKNSKQRFNARSKLSELFFQHEQEVMATMIDYIKHKQPDNEILLQVHDCIYVKYHIDVNSLHDILRIDDVNPYMRIGYKKIDRYANLDLLEQNEHQNIEHMERIRAEEALAKNYQSANVMIDTETANKPRPKLTAGIDHGLLHQGEMIHRELAKSTQAQHSELWEMIQNDYQLLKAYESYQAEKTEKMLSDIEFAQNHGEYINGQIH